MFSPEQAGIVLRERCRVQPETVMNENKRQVIRARAYHLWEQDGCPPGRDLEYWLEAEREIVEADRRHEEIVASHPPRLSGEDPGGRE